MHNLLHYLSQAKKKFREGHTGWHDEILSGNQV
jgi:hypothetical protein